MNLRTYVLLTYMKWLLYFRVNRSTVHRQTQTNQVLTLLLMDADGMVVGEVAVHALN